MRSGPRQQVDSKRASGWRDGGTFAVRLSRRFAGPLLITSISILGITSVLAQGVAAPAPGSVAKHAKKSSTQSSVAASQALSQPAPAVPVTPAVAPLPDWPANDHPSDATVTWDSHGLGVIAANSSLSQILKEISTRTGASLEGLGRDQRIFGVYGPGPAREVIAQLLDGSSYNVLMIGDSGQGTPRQIILTPQPGGAAQSPSMNNQNSSNDDDSEPEQQAAQPEPPPQQQAPAMVPGANAPAVPARSQQQIIEQLQERQREIMQQQQQQQPQNP